MRFRAVVVARVLVLLLAVTGPQLAHATPLTLNGPIQGNTVGPQSQADPCIIASIACSQPALFGYNNYTESPAITSYNMFSTTPTSNFPDGVQGTPYLVAQLVAAVGNAFNIGIDVNTTARNETLQLFEVIINGAVAYNFVGPALVGNVANNGAGFADFTLNTVSLAGLSPTATVLFHAFWNNASGDGETFFLIPTAPISSPVPEPASMLLLGTGLVGVGARRWRNRRQRG